MGILPSPDAQMHEVKLQMPNSLLDVMVRNQAMHEHIAAVRTSLAVVLS